jgi:hypothetical protein
MTVFSLFHERRTGFMKQILGYGKIFSQAAQKLLTTHVLQLKTAMMWLMEELQHVVHHLCVAILSPG